MKKCKFIENIGTYYGGAIYNDSTDIIALNCIFSKNKAISPYTNKDSYGGGMYSYKSSTELINCVFYENNADIWAGFLNERESNAKLINCTFVYNSGNGYYSGRQSNGVVCRANSSIVILNSIFYQNGVSIGISDDSAATVANCAVENGFSGGDNIVTSYPYFRSPSDPDGYDNKWGTADDGLVPYSSSVIDVGDNAALPLDTEDIDNDGDRDEVIFYDLKWDSRIMGGKVDLGAYEYRK